MEMILSYGETTPNQARLNITRHMHNSLRSLSRTRIEQTLHAGIILKAINANVGWKICLQIHVKIQNSLVCLVKRSTHDQKTYQIFETISAWNGRRVTKYEQVQAPVVVVLVYKQTLRAIYTTTQKLYKILVADLIY